MSLGDEVEFLEQQRFLPLDLLVLGLVVDLLLAKVPLLLGELLSQNRYLLLEPSLHLLHLLHQGLLVAAARHRRETH